MSNLKKGFTSKVPWREKIERVKEYKIVEIPPKMQKRFGKGKMLIPKPADLEALIKKIRKGKLITKSELRKKLSSDFNVDVTCPVTTGIFFRIISEAAGEEIENGKKNVTPCWRVINNDGSLNEKFPGGVKKQAEILKKEGHQIEKSKDGKILLVESFEKKLSVLN